MSLNKKSPEVGRDSFVAYALIKIIRFDLDLRSFECLPLDLLRGIISCINNLPSYFKFLLTYNLCVV